MQLESRKYLFDIQRAVELLREFTDGKSFEDYEQDAMLRAAVEREFEIIGEALGQLARIEEAVAAQISGYKRIIAFRNILIHQYADVDDRLVWDVVETYLPVFRHGMVWETRGPKGSHHPLGPQRGFAPKRPSESQFRDLNQKGAGLIVGTPVSPVLRVRVPDEFLQRVEPLVHGINERLQPLVQPVKSVVHLLLKIVHLGEV